MMLYTVSVRWHVFKDVRKLAVVAAFYVCMLILIPFLTYKSEVLAKQVMKIHHFFGNTYQNIRAYYKKIIQVILIYTGVCLLDILAVKGYALITAGTVNYILTSMVIGLTYLPLTVYFLRREIKDRPEKLFLCFSLILGTLLILCLPNNTGVNWDDEVHYTRVETLANFADEQGYAADDIVLDNYKDSALNHRYYSESERAALNQEVNDSYAKREAGAMRTDIGVYSIAYIPYAVPMIVGKALHLPFTFLFCFAKFFNLLLYSTVVYLGMKKLKFGKIFTAVLALIPTILFMAGNYAYDPWILSLMIYGFCYYFSFLQDREKKMTREDRFLMLGAFILGILPKAIYFVILFPLFFLPKTSFETKKEHHKYLFLLLLSGLFLAATFLLPLLIHGAGTGDTRGSSDVNSTLQIQYILSEPGKYASMMWNFLLMYFNLGNAREYTLYFAYFDRGTTGTILTTAVLYLTAILDKDGQKTKTVPIMIVTALSFLCTVILVATALYISFTPLRYFTILGCQYRYLVPLLYPLLFLLTPDRVKCRINRFWFNSIPMLYMGIIFLINLFPLISATY